VGSIDQLVRLSQVLCLLTQAYGNGLLVRDRMLHLALSSIQFRRFPYRNLSRYYAKLHSDFRSAFDI